MHRVAALKMREEGGSGDADRREESTAAGHTGKPSSGAPVQGSYGLRRLRLFSLGERRLGFGVGCRDRSGEV